MEKNRIIVPDFAKIIVRIVADKGKNCMETIVIEKTKDVLDENLLKLELKHPSCKAIKCWTELLDGCSTLNSFMGRIEKYSKMVKEDTDFALFDKRNEKKDFDKKSGEDKANIFKGDVCEIFSEYFLSGWGRMYDIYNYKPIFVNGDEQDIGVDGTGETKDGRVVTVQIKFGQWNEQLNNFRRGLHTFHWTSLNKYKVGNTSLDQMFIVTLAQKVDWRTLDQYFHGRLRFISREASTGIISLHNKKPIEFYSIKRVCDKNLMFFSTLKEKLTRKE